MLSCASTTVAAALATATAALAVECALDSAVLGHVAADSDADAHAGVLFDGWRGEIQTAGCGLGGLGPGSDRGLG